MINSIDDGRFAASCMSCTVGIVVVGQIDDLMMVYLEHSFLILTTLTNSVHR